LNGSTENQRDAAQQAAGQVGAAIDPTTGNIVIVAGNRPLFSMTLPDALTFAAGLCQLLAHHPKLKTPTLAQEILIAGTCPPFARH
jgi:hypothetical protein